MEPRPVEPGDVLELSLVSSPAAGDGVAYVVSKPDGKGERLESSIWLWSRGAPRPLTSGPGDACPAWGPRGLLAFTRRQGRGEAAIAVLAPGLGEPRVVARSRFGFRSLRWGGRRIFALSRAPLGGGEWRDYEDRDALVVERLPVWFNGEGFIFDRRVGVVAVDPDAQSLEWVVHGPFDVAAYTVSGDGGLLAYAVATNELRPYLHEVRVRDLRSGEEWVLATGLTVAELEFSPNPRRLAIKARDPTRRGFAGHFSVYTIPTGGGELECLSCDLGLNTLNTANSDSRGPSCTPSLQWAPTGLYTLVSDAGRVHLYRLEPKGPEPIIAPECGVVDEFSVSGTGEIYYTVMTPTQPKELYRRTPSGAERLTRHTEAWRAGRILAEPRHYRIKAGDGAELDFWVLPPARPTQGGGAPWVLYIHGGPKTMYGCGFMLEFHALSGAGLAVVYGNPRGSDGYSEEFADIRGRYGERDYEDLMEIAGAAPRFEPSLDPERAGVAGGSYGGFMTAWIITRTTRFKAAAPQRLCSNWISMHGTSDIGWYFTEDQIAPRPPWEDPEAYWQRSPLSGAARIETPTLIIHSLEDYRCHVEQAIQLFIALKRRGVPARLALFPGENHDLSRTGTPRRKRARIALIRDWMLKWLSSGKTRSPSG
ncbi:MAG: S9 family peptidase [Desulfurococcales archaeon]|nr:S9 family peptidase [Desulfurococcales archaeon]